MTSRATKIPITARALAALALAATASCSGRVGEPVAEDDSSLCVGRVRPGPGPIRRLTNVEYDNTVRDLLGDDSRPARDFPPEEQALGFDNNADALGVTQLLAESYMVAAEGIATRALARPDAATFVGCDLASGDEACARAFVERFGARAWRRPLSGEEVEHVLAVFRSGRDQWDFRTGIELAMQALLGSPHFLYRVELGVSDELVDPDGDVVPVSPYELASRLSYLLWGSMPDDALLEAAAQDALRTPAQLEAQARRMLADPRARARVADFHRQWLLLDHIAVASKDTNVFPMWHAGLADKLMRETDTFVEHVIFEQHGSVRDLLTAPYTFVDAELAAYYGLPDGPTGDAFEQVATDPAQRAGLLTQGAILAGLGKPNQTSPVLRGKFVREQLLCQILPPPPPDVDVTPPDLDPNLTTRERFKAHAEEPLCAGCHHLMDPIGFGFENYDGIGRWRTTEGNDLPIDASGEILGSDDADGAFVGAVELGARLAASEQVQRCVATQWFRYAYGRGEAAEDRCTQERLFARFAASGYAIEDLLVALTQTDAFRYRHRFHGEAP